MAEVFHNSDLVIPFMPSLRHLCLMKVGMKLIFDFDMNTLNSVFREVLPGYSPGIHDGGIENLEEEYKKAEKLKMQFCKLIFEMHFEEKVWNVWHTFDKKENPEVSYNRVKELLLFLPNCLRSQVLETVLGLHYSIQEWQDGHFYFFTLRDFKMICFRSDGTMDRLKTAQLLVLDESFDIKERIKLANIYHLEESEQTLLRELEASVKASNDPKAKNEFDALRDGSWKSKLLTMPIYLTHMLPSHRLRRSRRPPISVPIASLDDNKFFLRVVPKQERDEMLKSRADELLAEYLKWPLQSLFLDMADRLWEYISDCNCTLLLSRFFHIKNTRKDFDYSKLFVEFWNRAPNRVKAYAISQRYFKKNIESLLNDRRVET